MKQLANFLLQNDRILSFVMIFLSKEKKEKIYISKFRDSFKLFGTNIDDYSDDEVKKALKSYALLSNECGLTSDEVGQAMKTVASQL